MDEIRQETRGVKKGTIRGKYKTKKPARGGVLTIRLSEQERAKLDALRGTMGASEYIRKTLKLS